MTRFFDIIMLHLCIYVTHVGVGMLYNRLADLAKGQRQCPRCNCRHRLASRDQISYKVNKSNHFSRNQTLSPLINISKVIFIVSSLAFTKQQSTHQLKVGELWKALNKKSSTHPHFNKSILCVCLYCTSVSVSLHWIV